MIAARFGDHRAEWDGALLVICRLATSIGTYFWRSEHRGDIA